MSNEIQTNPGDDWNLPEFEKPQGENHTSKKILVAALLVGLILAIIFQPKKETSQAELLDASVPAASGPVAPTVEASLEKAAERFSISEQRSRVLVSKIADTKAFHFDLQTRMTRKPAARVQAIYGAANTKSALVGKDIVRSGNPLSDGRKVIDVSHAGIHVAP